MVAQFYTCRVVKKCLNSTINMVPEVCLWRLEAVCYHQMVCSLKSDRKLSHQLWESVPHIPRSPVPLCPYVLLGGSIQFSVYLLFLMDEDVHEQMKNCVILQLVLDVPIPLEPIHIFKTSRADSTYLQTRSHTVSGLL